MPLVALIKTKGNMYIDESSNGASSGFYQAVNWLKLHNHHFKVAVGSVEFTFNSSKLASATKHG
jgi:hypothetical protein